MIIDLIEIESKNSYLEVYHIIYDIKQIIIRFILNKHIYKIHIFIVKESEL